MFKVTKTYGHDLGLSACFRQWRAKSHCRFLHGYPLSFKLTFAAPTLDENNWVLDFGGLKEIKAWLVDHFDHKLLVAEDDPFASDLVGLGRCLRKDDTSQSQLADVLMVPTVGCEGFAKMTFDHVKGWLAEHPQGERVRLVSVEVREHGGNSAIYEEEYR